MKYMRRLFSPQVVDLVKSTGICLFLGLAKTGLSFGYSNIWCLNQALASFAYVIVKMVSNFLFQIRSKFQSWCLNTIR